MGTEVYPFRDMQVVDYGDIPCNPFNIPKVRGSDTWPSTDSVVASLGTSRVFVCWVVRKPCRFVDSVLFFLRIFSVWCSIFLPISWRRSRRACKYMIRPRYDTALRLISPH